MPLHTQKSFKRATWSVHHYFTSRKKLSQNWHIPSHCNTVTFLGKNHNTSPPSNVYLALFCMAAQYQLCAWLVLSKRIILALGHMFWSYWFPPLVLMYSTATVFTIYSQTLWKLYIDFSMQHGALESTPPSLFGPRDRNDL